MTEFQRESPKPKPTFTYTTDASDEAESGAETETGGPGGPPPPITPPDPLVEMGPARRLKRSAAELERAALRARRTRRRVVFYGVLTAVALVGLGAGIVANSTQFWASAGAVFAAAMIAVVTDAAKELGGFSKTAETVSGELTQEAAAAAVRPATEDQVSAREIERAVRTSSAYEFGERLYGPFASVAEQDETSEAAEPLRPAYLDAMRAAFSEAARGGEARASRRLGDISLFRGERVSAEEYYLEAANRGNTPAAFALASLHATEVLTEDDFWQRKARNEKSSLAAYVLGTIVQKRGLRPQGESPGQEVTLQVEADVWVGGTVII